MAVVSSGTSTSSHSAQSDSSLSVSIAGRAMLTMTIPKSKRAVLEKAIFCGIAAATENITFQMMMDAWVNAGLFIHRDFWLCLSKLGKIILQTWTLYRMTEHRPELLIGNILQD